MSASSWISRCILIASTLFAIGCSTVDDAARERPRIERPTFDRSARLDTGEQKRRTDVVEHRSKPGATPVPQGKKRIKIDLGEQRAYFYAGSTVLWTSAVSTGREGYSTPAGSYRIQSKHRDHVSSLYGKYVAADGTVLKKDAASRKDPKPAGATFKGSPMPYFMPLTKGIGLHAGHVPGYPASHGCIRLPAWSARRAFETMPVGTPVQIVR